MNPLTEARMTVKMNMFWFDVVGAKHVASTRSGIALHVICAAEDGSWNASALGMLEMMLESSPVT